jgi:hypothetical protein
MATDATGTPTAPDSIPKFNTSVDAPSGLGSNAQMDAIQTALSARINKSVGTTNGDIIYFTGASTPARLGIGSSGQVLTVSGGVPAWSIAPGMTLIDDLTVTGSALASYDTNTRLGGVLPTGYKHLRLLVSARVTSLGDYSYIRLNNDSGANYSQEQVTYNGAARADSYAAGQTATFCGMNPGSGDTAGKAGIADILLPDYNGTTFRKMVQANVTATQQAGNYQGTVGGEWASTAAVTRLTVLPGLTGSTFVIGSRFSLYGIN